MNKILNLRAILVTMNFLCGMVSASDENFLKDFEKDMWPTLNNKGDHLPNLGPAQEEFYEYCKALDLNMNIQRPVVAIFGGAYGKRAAAVLQQTSRLTVILNDLDAGHFEGIQQWSKHNNFDKRLKLAVGSFLDIQECKYVQDFFSDSPIIFNAILMANVFHYLHPVEGMKGLRYIADHLADDGEAFLMTAQIFGNVKGEAEEQRVAKELLNINEGIQEQGIEWVKQIIAESGISVEETYIIYMQNRQQKLLYEFNKTHGIIFPGYFSDEVDTLNPLFLKLSNFLLGAPKRISFFLSTPEEMKHWCNTVGLTFQNVQHMNINKDQVIIFNPYEARYYFARLKRSSSPIEAEYIALLQQAEGVDQALKKLHAGKFFEVRDEPPYFRITDRQAENDLFTRLLKGDMTAIVPLGHLCLEYKDLESAKDFFRFAADIGIVEGQEELNRLI